MEDVYSDDEDYFISSSSSSSSDDEDLVGIDSNIEQIESFLQVRMEDYFISSSSSSSSDDEDFVGIDSNIEQIESFLQVRMEYVHSDDEDYFISSSSSSSSDDEDLVGIDSNIEQIESFLQVRTEDVHGVKLKDSHQFKYDVFLSFRGEDTRYNIISHLHAALYKKNIKIFIDYQLRKGYEISPSLLTAIEESRISIVVFSKDYASSTWCLQELAKIIECREMQGQIVIPVFYGINPSDVRKQTGTFQDAFAKQEQAFGYKTEKLQEWRTALTKAANLSGWDSSITRVEYVLVNKIVKDVLGKLEYLSSITELMGLQLFYNLTNLVLNDCNIKELPESLGSLTSVKMLSLCRNNFESIPASIINLSKLILLNISYCERLKSLPILPRDLKLVAHNCTSLEAFELFTCRPSYTLVVDFINCFRLQQNALRYLVDHAVQKIQHIPSALYTELDEESDDEMHNVFICYPGNEVPEWFTFRRTGSFVIVRHLPQGWFSDNLVGLAVCAVVAFQHHYDDDGRGLVLVCECEFISEDRYRHVARGYFFGWGNDKYGIHYVGSDHVFLGCDFVMYPENFGEYYYTNEFSVQFYIEDNYSERMHCCEVKKCGVRLIYQHEFGNSILSTSSDEDYFCKYLEEINGSFGADMRMEEEIPHGPRQMNSKLFSSLKDQMQIKSHVRVAATHVDAAT